MRGASAATSLFTALLAASCSDGPSHSDAASAGESATSASAGAGGAGGGGAACVPRASVKGITGSDDGGRVLNARGIDLTDWDGFVANPTVTLTLAPPADIAFPSTATLAANHPRLYFDMPSTVGAEGPRKKVGFDTAASRVE